MKAECRLKISETRLMVAFAVADMDGALAALGLE